VLRRVDSGVSDWSLFFSQLEPPPAWLNATAHPHVWATTFGLRAAAIGALTARGPFGKLMGWLTDKQQKMQRELAGSVKRLKSGNAIAAALALAGLLRRGARSGTRARQGDHLVLCGCLGPARPF
jgi:hypothetical protein